MFYILANGQGSRVRALPSPKQPDQAQPPLASQEINLNKTVSPSAEIIRVKVIASGNLP